MGRSALRHRRQHRLLARAQGSAGVRPRHARSPGQERLKLSARNLVALLRQCSGLAASARRRRRRLLLAALALRIGVAWFLPNLLWPDEIFQTLEQGHRLAFGYGVVPWEFNAGVRSWLFPGALGGILRAAAALGASARGELFAVECALCAISLVPIWIAWGWTRERGAAIALAAAAACAVWFELVYFAPKALNEVVAAHAMLAALYLAGESGRGRAAAAGALLALAAALRMHLLPAAVVGAWAMRGALAGRFRPFLAAGAAVLLFAGALDAITWAYPFSSYVGYARLLLLEGKAAEWGAQPWYWYARILAHVWWWAALPLLALAALGALRKPELAWMAAAVLVSHSAIGHKEYRFIYPAVAATVVLAALGTAELLHRFAAPRGAAALAGAAWAAASLGLALRFTTGAARGKADGESQWLAEAGVLRAFDAAARGPALCGVGLVGIDWVTHGGYTRLHQRVPIYVVAGPADLRERAPGFDLTIARLTAEFPLRAEQAERCFPDGICLFRRAGGCRPEPGALAAGL